MFRFSNPRVSNLSPTVVQPCVNVCVCVRVVCLLLCLPVSGGGVAAVGHVTGAGLGLKSPVLAFSLSHLAARLAALLAASGAPLRPMIAAIAWRSTVALGALGSVSNGTPGRKMGSRGHPHGVVGVGSSWSSPSPSFIPGQLALLTCSDMSRRAPMLAGYAITVYFTRIPFFTLLDFARWQTSLRQNFPIPHFAKSLDRIGLGAAPSRFSCR